MRSTPEPPPRIPRRTLKVLTAVLSAVLALAAAELGLRIAESLRPDPDEDGADEVLDYGDTWREGGLGPGGFLQEGFDGRVRDGYGGTVRWVNNTAGFRRIGEVSRTRKPGTLRILSLGDSFTGGYRVGQEETFSHLLEEHLEETGRWREVEVLVSVIEEPPTGLRYLADEGLDWHPDLVLLGVTLGNDLGQTYVTLDPRGGLRLFADRQPPTIAPNSEADQEALVEELRTWTLPDGCFDPEAARPPEPPQGSGAEPAGGLRLLALARGFVEDLRQREAPQAVTSLWGEYRRPLLFDNNGLGMYLQPPPPRIRTAHERLESVLGAYRTLTAAHGTGFAVALFPQRFQVQARDWRETIGTYGLEPECFDLMAPNRRILDACREADIPCFDPTPAMRERFEETGRSLYLPRGDMHWNARGHRAFFEAVRAEVEALAETNAP